MDKCNSYVDTLKLYGIKDPQGNKSFDLNFYYFCRTCFKADRKSTFISKNKLLKCVYCNSYNIVDYTLADKDSNKYGGF